ncbi:MAG: hypothetical protein ABJ360_03605, partial [Roseobacter sp.]
MTHFNERSVFATVCELLNTLRYLLCVVVLAGLGAGAGHAQTFTIGNYDVYINDRAGFEARGSATVAEDPTLTTAAAATYAGGIAITSSYTLGEGGGAFAVSGQATTISPVINTSSTGTSVIADISPDEALGFSIIDVFDHGAVGSFNDVISFAAGLDDLFTLSTGLNVASGLTGPVDVRLPDGSLVTTVTVGQATSTFVGVVDNTGAALNAITISYDYEYQGAPFNTGQDLHGLDQIVTVDLATEVELEKTAGTPTLNPDGTFDVTYTLVMQNTGDLAVENLTLFDDLASQFGAGFTASDATDTSAGVIVAPSITNLS